MPDFAGDPVTGFAAKAKATVAQVHEIASAADAPVRILDILRAAGTALELHIPAESPLNQLLPWATAPDLTISPALPSGDEAAFSSADYGIAETGTAVFFSGPGAPSSWHFRPGREFILLEKSRIVARFEDVIARIAPPGRMPATLNLVTGPSRTADIEQTIELGAHGPRELHILIAG